MRARGVGTRVSVLVVLAALGGCSHRSNEVRLEKPDDEDVPIPVVPVPAADGPRLGAVANSTPIVDRPSHRGTVLGYLHAGETVARAPQPFSRVGCGGGWYAIRPVGFVCAESTATTDLTHPTLTAMSLQPKFGEALPYTYARTTRDTSIYEVDPASDARVRPLSALRARSGLAVVGSWNATDPNGTALHLAMMTDGHFVDTADLETAATSHFAGVELGERTELPMAFVVKRGVRLWSVTGDEPEPKAALDYHDRVALTGRFRTIGGVTFWAKSDREWVRERDVTLVRERHDFPDFVDGDQKWLDVSVITGTLVAYEGKKPVFVTLVSVGKDRLGAPESDAATRRGEFAVVSKQVTFVGADPATLADGASIYDAPWALGLESGQSLFGAYWHDRFGIEHGPGNIELSPSDAARLFRWVDPALPDGWHGVSGKPRDGKPTIVDVRK